MSIFASGWFFIVLAAIGALSVGLTVFLNRGRQVSPRARWRIALIAVLEAALVIIGIVLILSDR